MEQKAVKTMGIEGTGPMIMAPAAIVFILGAIVSYVYRPTFDMFFIPREITLVVGAILVIVGVPIWLSGVVYFFLAYRKGELATGGPYALMLNPIYNSWTALIFPGIAFLLNWWLLFATPVIMYIAFRYFIGREDDYLRQKFGKRYDEYRNKVLIKFL